MLGKPALSYSNTPAFKSLVEAVIDAGRITILCGAGVSIDAGLPAWPILLKQIAEKKAADGDRLARLIPLTEQDLLRTAGLLIRSRGGRTAQLDHNLVSSALYQHQADPPSTYLAKGIARLAGTRPERIGIATFNFDDLLEQALEEEVFDVVSCSLDDRLDDWWRAFDHPDEPVFHVLHLHGFLGRSQPPLGPLVLTEDEFRRHGQRVQAEVRGILKRSDVVLGLGLSLTDPNLIGPLAEVGSESAVFLTTAANKVDGASPDEAEQLALAQAKYLSDLFSVQVIPLNAYSQNSQLMIELELALSRPRAYRSNTKRHCERYGYRLARSLDAAYRTMGWPRTRSAAPSGDNLAHASNQLQVLLDDIKPRLVRLVEDNNHETYRLLSRELARKNLDVHEHLMAEGLALFLWLPSRFDPTNSKPQRDYDLRLVGSSAYSHRAFWSFDREPVKINAYSSESQARAAWSGQTVIEPSTPRNEPRLWRTNVAVPLSVRSRAILGSRSLGPSAQFANVSLGAIVLASNRPLAPIDGEHHDLAAVTYLDKRGQAEYGQLIADAAADFLTEG